jgi:hypothetical protein
VYKQKYRADRQTSQADAAGNFVRISSDGRYLAYVREDLNGGNHSRRTGRRIVMFTLFSEHNTVIVSTLATAVGIYTR